MAISHLDADLVSLRRGDFDLLYHQRSVGLPGYCCLAFYGLQGDETTWNLTLFGLNYTKLDFLTAVWYVCVHCSTLFLQTHRAVMYSVYFPLKVLLWTLICWHEIGQTVNDTLTSFISGSWKLNFHFFSEGWRCFQSSVKLQSLLALFPLNFSLPTTTAAQNFVDLCKLPNPNQTGHTVFPCRHRGQKEITVPLHFDIFYCVKSEMDLKEMLYTQIQNNTNT